jgi:hypothetical protein
LVAPIQNRGSMSLGCCGLALEGLSLQMCHSLDVHVSCGPVTSAARSARPSSNCSSESRTRFHGWRLVENALVCARSLLGQLSHLLRTVCAVLTNDAVYVHDRVLATRVPT